MFQYTVAGAGRWSAHRRSWPHGGFSQHGRIVMTSNLGSQMIQEMANDNDYQRMKAAVMEIVAQHFRPEFLNRVDESVVFHPLDRGRSAPSRLYRSIICASGWPRGDGPEITEAALDRLGEAGIRSGIRCAAVEACNPAAAGKSAGPADSVRSLCHGDLIRVDAAGDGLTFAKPARWAEE